MPQFGWERHAFRLPASVWQAGGMQTEPVRIVAGIQTAVIAVWGVLILVLNIDDDLAGAVTIALGAVVSAIAAIVVRERVTPVGSGPVEDAGQGAIDLLIKVIVVIILVILVLALVRRLA